VRCSDFSLEKCSAEWEEQISKVKNRLADQGERIKIANRIARVSWMACACIILVASQAFADGKNYPGSVCVKWGTGGIVTISSSRIGNSSVSTTLEIDCPAMKDGGATTSGFARVLDRNSSSSIQCSLVDAHVLLTDAVVYTDFDSDSSTGSSNTHQELTFGSQTSAASSYKYLACSIPPTDIGTSYVAMFNIDEA
jgi:hypothetical protein